MNELINAIASRLTRDAGNVQWDIIVYDLLGVTTFWQESAEMYLNGSSESIETTDDDDDSENSPMYYAKQLRQAMYEQTPNKGAWYTLNLTIQASGKFNIDFDYDDKPNFNIEIDEERYVWDFEKYPRDAASTPDWLQTILSRKTQ